MYKKSVEGCDKTSGFFDIGFDLLGVLISAIIFASSWV